LSEGTLGTGNGDVLKRNIDASDLSFSEKLSRAWVYLSKDIMRCHSAIYSSADLRQDARSVYTRLTVIAVIS